MSRVEGGLWLTLIAMLCAVIAYALWTAQEQRVVALPYGDVTCYYVTNRAGISCLPAERLVRVLNIYEPVPNRPYQVRLGQTVLLVQDSSYDKH